MEKFLYLPQLKSVKSLLKTAFKWLGYVSIPGAVAVYIAWLPLPPELVVEGVIEKSEIFSSESRIEIRNTGMLPALDIRIGALNIEGRIGTLTIQGTNVPDSPTYSISKLGRDEKTEMSITPGATFAEATHIDTFSYDLHIKYFSKILFFKKEYSKHWKVELRRYNDKFSWFITKA